MWSHAFGLVWFLPGVAGGIPTPSVATFQWFWGTDKGTRWDGSSSQLGALYTAIQFAGPNLTKKTADAVPARLRKANAGVGGAYSDSAFTFEAPPPPADGGVARPRRGAGAGGTPTRRAPATTTCRLPGKGEYMYLDGGQALRPRRVPEGQEEVLRPRELDGHVPGAPGVRARVADVPLPGLPEQRQQLDHREHGPGLITVPASQNG